MDIEKRIRMAAESILENESLRHGLEEDGESALLDWGIACAKQIAADTQEFEDDLDAEDASYSRTTALYKLLEGVKGLYTSEVDALQRTALLEEIASCIPEVYRQELPAMETIRWNVFVAMQPKTSIEQKIKDLRALIENKPATLNEEK